MMQERASELENLVGAICNAFENVTVPVRSKHVSPLQEYSDRKLEIRAAVSSWFLQQSPDTDGRNLGAAVEKLIGGGLSHHLRHASATHFIGSHIQELERLRQAATDHLRAETAGKSLEAVTSLLNSLISLGDTGFVAEKLRVAADKTGFHALYLQGQFLKAVGLGYDASVLSSEIIRSYPELAAAWYVDTTLPFRHPGEPRPLFQRGVLSGPESVRAHITELVDRNDFGAALDVVAGHPDLVRANVGLALAALRALLPVLPIGNAQRTQLDSAAAKMSPHLRLKYIKLGRTLTHEVMSSLAMECLETGMPMASIQGLLSDVWNMVLREAPNLLIPLTDQITLLMFGKSLFSGPVPQERAGGLPPAMIIQEEAHLRQCLKMKGRYRKERAELRSQQSGALTDRAKCFLDKARSSQFGTLLYGNHSLGIDEIAYLPMHAAAAKTGRKVMGLLRAQNPSEIALHQDWAMSGVVDPDIVEILNIFAADDATQTQKLIAHLRSGGVLDVANDGLNAPGVRVLVPWIARPYTLRSFPAQLALATASQIGFRTICAGKDGAVRLDIVPVAPPPTQGSMRVRAIWLTQRLAKLTRQGFAEDPATFPVDRLTLFGGIPELPPLLDLKEWALQPAVRSSLIAWLAKEAPKLPQSQVGNYLTQADIREPALRMASLLIHFQANSPRHNAPDRRFNDQHRIAFIGPQGAAMLATGIGAFAAGSLLCPIQADIAPDVALERLKVFQPDLILATASSWTEILKLDNSDVVQPVLILDDAGDAASLEDLLLSFQPADALPSFDSDQAGFVVFTSGSDGLPKGVVVPAGVLSNNSGLDRCAQLELGERVCYLTRWDAVGLSDIMACIRGGASIVIPEPKTLDAPSALAAWLADMQIDFLSAPVSLWRLLLRTKMWSLKNGIKVSKGLLWGEPITASVEESLARQAPELKAFCIYGSTEVTYTAFGNLRDAPVSGRTGSPGGHPIEGTLVTPVDGTEVNATRISSPNRMLGYFHDLARSNPPHGHGSEEAVVVNDVVNVRDGFVEVLGRSDSVFKSAGRRYSIRQFEKSAEDIPGVEIAIGFLRQTDTNPELLVAVQSRADDSGVVLQQVADAVRSSSNGGVRAREITILTELPVMANGKIDRQALLNTFTRASNEGPKSAPAAPTRPVYGGALEALHGWATELGLPGSAEFDPDQRLPEFSSIEMLELSLILDEIAPGLHLDELSLTGGASWRSIGRLIDKIKEI
ncbi:MAG: class I adenylate-forming enzyme family protein [Hyphomonas sp.]